MFFRFLYTFSPYILKFFFIYIYTLVFISNFVGIMSRTKLGKVGDLVFLDSEILTSLYKK
jgi:hypothetical protein